MKIEKLIIHENDMKKILIRVGGKWKKNHAQFILPLIKHTNDFKTKAKYSDELIFADAHYKSFFEIQFHNGLSSRL